MSHQTGQRASRKLPQSQLLECVWGIRRGRGFWQGAFTWLTYSRAPFLAEVRGESEWTRERGGKRVCFPMRRETNRRWSESSSQLHCLAPFSPSFFFSSLSFYLPLTYLSKEASATDLSYKIRKERQKCSLSTASKQSQKGLDILVIRVVNEKAVILNRKTVAGW